MRKKIIPLVQAIVQAITIIFLFVPEFFTQIVCIHRYGYSPSIRTYAENALDTVSYITGAETWVVLLLIFFIIHIVYFLLCFTTSIKFLKKKLCIAIPCLSTIFLSVSVIKVLNYHDYDGNYQYMTSRSLDCGVSWAFYVACALYLVVILLELFKHFSKLPETKETKSNTSINSDNLEKLKEYLDKGIITQEEFDAKKKQLLGL